MEKVVTKECRKVKIKIQYVSSIVIGVLGSTHLVLRDVAGMLNN